MCLGLGRVEGLEEPLTEEGGHKMCVWAKAKKAVSCTVGDAGSQ